MRLDPRKIAEARINGKIAQAQINRQNTKGASVNFATALLFKESEIHDRPFGTNDDVKSWVNNLQNSKQFYSHAAREPARPQARRQASTRRGNWSQRAPDSKGQRQQSKRKKSRVQNGYIPLARCGSCPGLDPSASPRCARASGWTRPRRPRLQLHRGAESRRVRRQANQRTWRERQQTCFVISHHHLHRRFTHFVFHFASSFDLPDLSKDDRQYDSIYW